MEIGCTSETLRKWVRQAERDQGLRAGVTSDERERLKALEPENREPLPDIAPKRRPRFNV
jgi:transposase-like protein